MCECLLMPVFFGSAKPLPKGIAISEEMVKSDKNNVQASAICQFEHDDGSGSLPYPFAESPCV